MIYGIFDRYENLIGYCTDIEKAEKYCAYHADEKYDYSEMLCLDDEIDFSSVPAKYEYMVYYYSQCGEEFMPCLTERKCYCAETLKPDSVVCFFYPDSKSIGDVLIVRVNLKEKDENRAEKIAQDYIDELAAYGNGRLDLDYMNLMNLRLKRQRAQENKERRTI